MIWNLQLSVTTCWKTCLIKGKSEDVIFTKYFVKEAWIPQILTNGNERYLLKELEPKTSREQ